MSKSLLLQIAASFIFGYTCFISVDFASAETVPGEKHVLILFEGSDSPTNFGQGDARELAMLLGHFNVIYTVKSVEAYASGEVNKFDLIFFIGYSIECTPPEKFLHDVYTTQKQCVWMNTGLDRFNALFDLQQKYGMQFVAIDTLSIFDRVTANNRTYTKGEENLNIVSVVRDGKAEVLATAYSTSAKREAPYIIRSGNFLYIADSPFASADETDRYILFADMLHEIIGEQHEELHRALLRIEDVDVFESPKRLRDIADLLSSKQIPFLVGVIPFFVDPDAGIRLSMSDKPEFVDAIHYMVEHGATIVMHGVTHQYQRVTASDFEFWDSDKDAPIRNDSKEYIQKKIKMGLDECWKNNIYPLVWETPHYAASQSDYPIIGSFFSTAMEQRQVLDNSNYGQYFPYIIERDLFGVRILPENLGYIPLSDTTEVEEQAVRRLLKGAEAQLSVRDGFASAFIHPFIDLKYIEEYVSGVLALGYTFMDVKNEPSIVRLTDRIILTGNNSYHIKLEDQYLRETWLNPDGKLDHWTISQDRVHDTLSKSVNVPTGQIYLAEPSEYRGADLTFFEKLRSEVKSAWEDLFQSEETFDEARVAVLWDPQAISGAYNDQASFASAFRSLNIQVDTLTSDTVGNLSPYNLLIVPYNIIEKLSNNDYTLITQFVEDGGHLITDGKNGLAEELGIKFAESSLKIERMRDKLYPEEALQLNSSEIMSRFEVKPRDEIFSVDERTEAPVVIGRKYGEGSFLFFGVRFDPLSDGGYSRFPYLLEYVRKYFQLRPILRREYLEMYFDPGFRHNVSVEDLVKRWVDNGVRIVHAASWHQYPTWTYNYTRLIELCHANGILVYAWLEPPHVSQKFWKEHPEWQELNYKGDPVPPTWRYLMALTEPECLTNVKSLYKNFLQTYDWDGVNLAELYFESDNGPGNPKLFTPMHPSAREGFKRKGGFDPPLLFDSLSVWYWKKNPSAWKRFEDYRATMLVKLHDEFLTMIDDVRTNKPYLDVIVTAMDNLGNPELRSYFGEDIQRIIELKKHHMFRLQVEDPQSEWSRDPRRYQQLSQRYQHLITGDTTKVMVDLNILQFRNETVPTQLQFPTLIQTGIESYQMVRSSALGADRYTIYSESSVRPQDFRVMCYAASGRATMKRVSGGWNVDVPSPMILELPKEYTSLRISAGQHLRSDRRMFFLPPGMYTLIAEKESSTPFSSPPTGGTLLSITGELTYLEHSNTNVEFAYKSDTRCIASFSHRPLTLVVDGSDMTVSPLEGYRRYSIMLPSGQHTINAVLATNVSYGIDITSFWSSWLIVGFGLLAGAALLILYGAVRFYRPSET